jgi:hypothetical protein
MAVRPLHSIPPYTPDDWSSDRRVDSESGLACANCGHDEWYHPVGIPPEDGAERKYRACKVCGFWQEADGSPPYRCMMTSHVCLGHLAEGKQCTYCGAWGPIHWHAGCWRVLRKEELGQTRCDNCGTTLDEGHVVSWPVDPEAVVVTSVPSVRPSGRCRLWFHQWGPWEIRRSGCVHSLGRTCQRCGEEELKAPHGQSHDWAPWILYEIRKHPHFTEPALAGISEEAHTYQRRQCRKCGRYEDEHVRDGPMGGPEEPKAKGD